MKKLLTPIALACALFLVPAGAANADTTSDKGWTNYSGKTKEGTKFSFAYRKGRIAIPSGQLPASCASAQGGTPRARITFFDPPDNLLFKVNGRESQFKVEEPWPTRYYTIAATRKGKRMVGKVRISWSLLIPNSVGGYSSLICQGTGNFDLKPQK